MQVPSVSVVVPVYASAATLPELVERLAGTLSGCAAEHEILLVVDACPGESWGVAASLAEETPAVRSVELPRNLGQQGALLQGIARARHAVVVTIDDDLQHPPEVLPELLAALTPELDVVYGAPRRRSHGAVRSAGSRLVRGLLRRLTGIDAMADASALRAFRTGLRDAFGEHPERGVSLDILLARATRRFGSVAVEHAPRASGASNYDARGLARVLADILRTWRR